MSQVNSGKNHPMYGKEGYWKNKILPEEHKRKISKANSGENSYNTEKTWAEINEIRQKYSTGKYTHLQLSKEYGLSCPQISGIINNKRWYDADYVPFSKFKRQ